MKARRRSPGPARGSWIEPVSSRGVGPDLLTPGQRIGLSGFTCEPGEALHRILRSVGHLARSGPQQRERVVLAVARRRLAANPASSSLQGPRCLQRSRGFYCRISLTPCRGTSRGAEIIIAAASGRPARRGDGLCSQGLHAGVNSPQRLISQTFRRPALPALGAALTVSGASPRGTVTRRIATDPRGRLIRSRRHADRPG